MILVEETQLFGNFLDTRVSKVEQLTGSLYFQLVEIVQRGTTRVAQEELPEMGGGIVGAAGNVVEGEPFAQMTAHVGDGRLCKIGVPGALDGAELHDVSVGSQQMPQAGTGITQVVGAVACFQIQEDFLKKGEALLQPGLGGFGNFEDVVEHGAEHVALLTRKVNPIDAPRVGARCGIGMRHAGFEQEELPFLHVLPATVNAEPAFAVNTMDKDVLGGNLRYGCDNVPRHWDSNRCPSHKADASARWWPAFPAHCEAQRWSAGWKIRLSCIP